MVSLLPFAKGYGLGADVVDAPSFLVQALDGGYAVRAARYWSSSSQYDGALILMDTAGGLRWAKSYGWGADHEYFYDIAAVPDGYILVGYTQSVSSSYDMFILKVDPTGGVVWYKVIGTPSADMAHHVLPTSDGGLLITGFTYSSGSGDALAVKLDSYGNLLWARRWGTDNLDKAYTAVETPSGYAITGFYDYFSPQVFLMEIRTDGSLAWAKSYDLGNDSKGYGLAYSGSEFYITGQFGSYGSADALVVRVDNGGNPVSAKSYDFSGDEDLFYGATFDGNLVITGTGRFGSYDMLLVKLSPSLSPVWAKTFDYGWDEGYEVIPVSGGYAVGFGAGSYNSVLVTDSDASSSCLSDVSPSESVLSFNSDTLPADFTYGTLSLTEFTPPPLSDSTLTPSQQDLCPAVGSQECAYGNGGLRWEVVEGGIRFSSEKPVVLRVYSPDGREVYRGEVKGEVLLPLKRGVYLWRGGRAVVR